MDVKALPHPGGTINTGVAYVAPGDETQRSLLKYGGSNGPQQNQGLTTISLILVAIPSHHEVISRISTVFNLSEDDITVMTMFQYLQ